MVEGFRLDPKLTGEAYGRIERRVAGKVDRVSIPECGTKAHYDRVLAHNALVMREYEAELAAIDLRREMS